MKTIKNILFWGIIGVFILAGIIIFILSVISSFKTSTKEEFIFAAIGIAGAIFLYGLHEQSSKE